MKSKAEVRLAFASPEEAVRVAASIEPENDGFLRATVVGHDLIVEAEADSPLSLLRTLDDALACIGAAEKASRVGARPRT